jgi:hypothetical protein
MGRITPEGRIEIELSLRSFGFAGPVAAHAPDSAGRRSAAGGAGTGLYFGWVSFWRHAEKLLSEPACGSASHGHG